MPPRLILNWINEFEKFVEGSFTRPRLHLRVDSVRMEQISDIYLLKGIREHPQYESKRGSKISKGCLNLGGLTMPPKLEPDESMKFLYSVFKHSDHTNVRISITPSSLNPKPPK